VDYRAGGFSTLRAMEVGMNICDQGLKSEPGLLSALQEAAKRKQTQREILEQRVSYVFGIIDSKNGVTREVVRSMLLEKDGLVETAV
jgi:hypothetical protein